MGPERINKYLSQRAHCSRRQADQMIEEGRVTIDGRVAGLGDTVGPHQEVCVDGQAVGEVRPKVYLIYNKPVGVICTADPSAPDNIIARVGHKERVFYVGRLDVDSSGLVLLTNDGSIVNKILKGRYGHEKEYRVEVYRPYDDDMLAAMVRGVDIGDEHLTLPAKVRRISEVGFDIRITEGRNRQIRRMVEALGHRVRHLHRRRFMHLSTQELGIDQWRPLTQEEVAELRRRVREGQEKPDFAPVPASAAALIDGRGPFKAEAVEPEGEIDEGGWRLVGAVPVAPARPEPKPRPPREARPPQPPRPQRQAPESAPPRPARPARPKAQPQAPWQRSERHRGGEGRS